MKKHFLIVWGTSIQAVRAGSGCDERVAALDAFGSYDPRSMTFKQVKLSELQSDNKRASLIKRLLTTHGLRFQFDARIPKLVQRELEENVFLREAK